MKTIIFVRHAKSSWDYEVDDKDRPLRKRGIVDANLVSNKLNIHQEAPQAIYTSFANRALHTATIFANNMDLSMDLLSVKEELYDFSGDKVLDFIATVDDNYTNIMLVGHNHAFTELVNKMGNISIDNLPTCGVVVVKFETDSWSDIINVSGRTILKIFPKEIR